MRLVHLVPSLEAPSPSEAVGLSAVSVSYGDGRVALSDASLSVAVGETVALVGANGAGKSTLLKAIAGAVDLGSGTVSVFGGARRASHHRLAYLPQVGEIDWDFPMSVERFVMTGRYPRLGWLRPPSRMDHDLVREAMNRVDIADLRARQVGALSGGQRQRTVLARALAQQADLLLLDEPLNAVDAETELRVLEVLRHARACGATLLMATHDVVTMRGLLDRVVSLADGRIVSVAPVAQSRAVAWPG